MIASAPLGDDARNSQEEFLVLLPRITRLVSRAFRSQPAGLRDDLVQEAVANAYVGYRRLVELGKREAVFPTPLARYAVRQVRSGRRVGNRQKSRDVLSPANRQVVVESLTKFDPADRVWKETLVEDRRVGPAETAAARLDVGRWFQSLPAKCRGIAAALAEGRTTSEAAMRFQLSPGTHLAAPPRAGGRLGGLPGRTGRVTAKGKGFVPTSPFLSYWTTDNCLRGLFHSGPCS